MSAPVSAGIVISGLNSFRQVRHPGAHAVDALRPQLAVVRRQVAAQAVQGYIHHDRAVVQGGIAGEAEGIAGELRPAAPDHQVVATGELRRYAEAGHRPAHHLQLAAHVVVRPGQHEAEIQVAHVVVHRAAAAAAPGQAATLILQQLHPALPPGILMPADDHGVPVLPQVQYPVVLSQCFEQQRLHRQVVPGVVGIADENKIAHSIASPAKL